MTISDSHDPHSADGDPAVVTMDTSGSLAGLDWRLGGTAGIAIGPTNSIADVTGITVGHASRVGDGWLTGSTVVLAPAAGAVAGVDVRGGGSATRETSALDPSGVVDRIQAVHFSGGSAYGLDSTAGVLAVLQDEGRGFRVGSDPRHVVPIVPAASIFDLGRGGDFDARPDAALAAEATRDALRGGPVRVGSVGAATGAVTGEMRGGVGTASAVLPGGIVVAALVVLNADGTTVDPRTGSPWGVFAELPLDGGGGDDGDGAARGGNAGGEFGIRAPIAAEHAAAHARLAGEAARRPPLRPLNTTLAVVATNADLGKAELTKLAGTAHDGMARAIRPVHTLGDGDVVFALSTTGGGLPDPAPGLEPTHRRSDAINQVLSAGADVVTRAIVHAILAAEPVTTPAGHIPSYRELYPEATSRPRPTAR